MQRFGMILERFISPEGAFPVFGRYYLPHRYPPTIGFVGMAWMVAQGIVERTRVRAAMTAVINRMFGDNQDFNEKGFLTLGFNGSQPLRLVY